jgi:hypothetical protein
MLGLTKVPKKRISALLPSQQLMKLSGRSVSAINTPPMANRSRYPQRPADRHGCFRPDGAARRRIRSLCHPFHDYVVPLCRVKRCSILSGDCHHGCGCRRPLLAQSGPVELSDIAL